MKQTAEVLLGFASRASQAVAVQTNRPLLCLGGAGVAAFVQLGRISVTAHSVPLQSTFLWEAEELIVPSRAVYRAIHGWGEQRLSGPLWSPPSSCRRSLTQDLTCDFLTL